MIAHKLQTVTVQQILKIAGGAILALCLAIGLMSASSLAQQSDENKAANALKVSPVRTDVSADPGETKIVKVTVTNPSSIRVGVRIIQNDFIAGDEEGTPAIILEETEYAESHSLKRFMTPLENIVLEGNESRVIDAEIVVPADAEPGGYFGVVRFAPTDPDSGGQVNVSPSVASLILLTVNGDAPEKLELTDFQVQQDGRKKSFFVSGDGIGLFARFQNKGDVQAGPFGKVSVLKGDKIVFEKDFNNKDPRDMVLPNSARFWKVPFEGTDSFGHYTVSATFAYGSKNQTIEVTQSFWVIPRNVIIMAVIGLIVLIGAIVGGVYYFRHRSNSMNRTFGAKRRR